MADLKGLADGAGQRAAIAAGKEMARRAVDDLTLSEEEKAKREEARQQARKKKLVKYGLIGVVGVVAVLSLMSLLAKLWMYAIGALVALGVGAVSWFTLKPRLAKLKERATARLEAKKRAAEAEKLRLEAAAREQAAADLASAQKQKLEDELAALKKKTGQG
jgi:hypothetical protein